jgi:hypothetical protein
MTPALQRRSGSAALRLPRTPDRKADEDRRQHVLGDRRLGEGKRVGVGSKLAGSVWL